MRRHRTKSVSTRIGTRRNGLPLGAPWGRSGVPAPPHAVLLCTNSEPAPRLALRVYAVTAYTHRAPPASQKIACGATGQGPASRTVALHAGPWPPIRTCPSRGDWNKTAKTPERLQRPEQAMKPLRRAGTAHQHVHVHAYMCSASTGAHARTHTRTHAHTHTRGRS